MGKSIANVFTKGVNFIGIDTCTPVKLPGGMKNNFQGRIVKRTAGINLMVGNSYEKRINKKMAKEGIEGTFKSKQRTWGTKIDGTPFVEHKGNYYITGSITQTSNSEVTYWNGCDQLFKQMRDEQPVLVDENGEFVTKLPKEYGQNEQAQGGIKDIELVRDFKLSHIVCMRVNGKVIINPTYKKVETKKGVYQDKNKWVANITIKGDRIRMRTDTYKQAVKLRKKLEAVRTQTA